MTFSQRNRLRMRILRFMAEASAQRCRAAELAQRFGQRLRIAGRHQAAVAAVDQFGVAAGVGRHHRQAVGHVFEDGVRQPFAVGTENADIEMLQPGADVPHRTGEMQTPVEPECSREVLEFPALRTGRRAGRRERRRAAGAAADAEPAKKRPVA